ncbi:rhodopsin, G0-coupled-like [Mytilus edulis]|uniref:rhodopsin, G0-coupled-like n=1 Tax=Mytilus edulis TaxID=6550 RepID=UPI0039EF5E5B
MSNVTAVYLPNEGILTEAEYMCIGVYLVVLGALSVLFNIFVIIVLVKGNPNYHAVHNILLLNISVSDLLLSAVAYPLWASTTFYYRWIWSDAWCTFSAFWCFTLAQNDMNTLAAISMCRYIIVCKPQYEYYLMKPRSKYVILVAIWSHSLLHTTAPLFGWSSYKQEAFGTSCSIDWTGHSASVITYNCIITLTCYGVHLFIFTYCYYFIIQELKAVASTPLNDQIVSVEKVRWYHRVSTSLAVTMVKTSLAMIAVFLIAWTPYAIVSIYSMFSNGLHPWTLVIPTMLAKSSTLLNPTVCALLSCKFRKAAMRLFSRKNKVKPIVDECQLQEFKHSSTSSGVRICEQGQNERIQYRGNLAHNDVFIGDMTISLPLDYNIV